MEKLTLLYHMVDFANNKNAIIFQNYIPKMLDKQCIIMLFKKKKKQKQQKTTTLFWTKENES